MTRQATKPSRSRRRRGSPGSSWRSGTSTTSLRRHKLTLKVDGKLAAEVIDNDPKQFDAAGILGLQLHSGPPTVAQFKDVRVKIIKAAE